MLIAWADSKNRCHGAEIAERERLRRTPFFGDRLLIDVQGDPAIGMPEQFLGNLHIDASRCRSIVREPWRNECHPIRLVHTHLLQNRTDVTLKDHVRLKWLRAILLNGREKEI